LIERERQRERERERERERAPKKLDLIFSHKYGRESHAKKAQEAFVQVAEEAHISQRRLVQGKRQLQYAKIMQQ
jgi:hypothetical protein